MLYERIIGKVGDSVFDGKRIDRVEIEWFETRNRRHRKTSRGGRDVAVSLGEDVLASGLRPGDVLGLDEDGTVIAVDVPPCEAIVVAAVGPDPRPLLKASYEIGNRHAPLFLGPSEGELVTPFDGPMKEMLDRIHGLAISVRREHLDFSRQLSSGAGHSHGHGHGH